LAGSGREPGVSTTPPTGMRHYVVARCYAGRTIGGSLKRGRIVAVRERDIDSLPTDLIGNSITNVYASSLKSATILYRGSYADPFGKYAISMLGKYAVGPRR
jgi:hypothetical protein